MSSDVQATEVYKRLRQLRPAKVAAIVQGEAKPLSVAKGKTRGKWERVIAMAAKLDAEGLELRDAQDGILEVLQLREAPADEPASLAEQLDELDPEARRVAHLVAISLDAADRQVQRVESMLAAALDGMRQSNQAAVDIMRLSVERTAQLERSMAGVIRQYEKLIAEAGGETDPMSSMTDSMATLVAAKLFGVDSKQLAAFNGLGEPKPNGKPTGKPDEDKPE